MKKFASAATAVLLVALMAVSCIVTAFAATEVTETSGSIKLTKYDSEDVGTRQPVSGAEFSVYRILDFDGKTYTVNSDFAGEVDVSDLVNTDASQTGTLSYGSTDKLEAQISKLQDYIYDTDDTDEGITPVAATATGTTGNDGVVTLENLDLGVYLVQETKVPEGYMVTTQAFLVALPTWDQANDNWVYAVEATPKNETLQVKKQITDGNQNTPDGTADDSYSIGDTVPYTVTAKIPNYGNASDDPTVTVTKNLLLQDGYGVPAYNALNLVFADTLTKGLTLNLDSLVVKVLDTDSSKITTLTKGNLLKEVASYDKDTDNKTLVTNSDADYTATQTTLADNSTEMTVTVAWESLDQYQGKTIQLTYTAQLDNDAVAGTADTNNVTYTFVNDPQKSTTLTGKTTTEAETNIYTYEMDLTKTFNGTAADGNDIDASTVEFTLTVTDTDDANDETKKQLSFIKNSDGNYTIWNGLVSDGKAYDINNETTKTTEVGDVVTALNPTSTGSLIVKGLEAGTYKLQETKSLDGYTILTEPVTILVEEVLDEETNSKVTKAVSAYTLAYNGADAEKKDTLADAAATGIFTLTINNAKNQFNLPLTGGLGLWMFTIAGGIVMAAAIIFFYVLHKKKSKDSKKS